MRTAMTLALGLIFAAAGAGFADDKPINTKCPKSGKECDGTHVASVKDGDKTVAVNACCDKCKGAIEGDSAKYLPAAQKNEKAAK